MSHKTLWQKYVVWSQRKRLIEASFCSYRRRQSLFYVFLNRIYLFIWFHIIFLYSGLHYATHLHGLSSYVVNNYTTAFCLDFFGFPSLQSSGVPQSSCPQPLMWFSSCLLLFLVESNDSRPPLWPSPPPPFDKEPSRDDRRKQWETLKIQPGPLCQSTLRVSYFQLLILSQIMLKNPANG